VTKPKGSVANSSQLPHDTDMSDKQIALQTIQRLPENASLEDISERLEYLAAIRKGLDQIKRGEVVPHDEVKRRLKTWLTK
jgi:predicted transcriptional regulator